MTGTATEKHCDVLIVGGGPAGSTIGALLAADGLNVVLLEKDHHPRFHIGESLLPQSMHLLERLGIRDQIARIGMPKYGIEFVSPWHADNRVEFHFAKAWDKSQPSAYQVRRSEFDHILLKNADAKGVQVLEGVRAGKITFPPEGGALIPACDEAGTEILWRAKYLVDASGRDTLLANQLGLKRANLRHNTAAVFGHFTNAKRLCGQAEGHISIFWFEHGWFWFIPLADGTTSIGAVCRPDYVNNRKVDATQFFKDTIALSPALSARLSEATLTGPATVTGNYSYKAERMGGPSYLMLGDAYAFIDPVFSTGVHIAMTSAFRAADVVRTALRTPAKAEAAAEAFECEVTAALKTFSWYIYRITRPALRDLFMAPSNVFRIEEAMMSLLAGDAFRKTPLTSRLLLFKGLFYLKTLGYRLRERSSTPTVSSAT